MGTILKLRSFVNPMAVLYFIEEQVWAKYWKTQVVVLTKMYKCLLRQKTVGDSR